MKLEAYIKQLFGYKTLPEKINRQIKTYLNKGYTYFGILQALKYFFEIKGNNLEKANGGIGIVPWVYEDAGNYWRDLWEARERNKDLEVQNIQIEVREIHISPPQRQPMKHIRRLFSFLEEDNE